MERKLVVPLDGRKIRCPDTLAHLPPEGRVVTFDTYWQRQLDDGSIDVLPAPPDES